MDFNVLEFAFVDTPPFNFPPAYICLSLTKLVIAFHSPSELGCSVLEHAQVYATAISIYPDGFDSTEGVSCAAVFHDFDGSISLPLVAFIFKAEL